MFSSANTMFWFFFLFSGLCAGIPLLTKPLFYKYCKLRHLTLYREKKNLLFLPLVAVMMGEMQMEWIERKKLLKLYIICSQWFQNICLESRSNLKDLISSVCKLSILFSIHFLVLKSPSKCIMVFFLQS